MHTPPPYGSPGPGTVRPSATGGDGLRRSAAVARRLGWAAVAASAALGVVFWRAVPGATSTGGTATVTGGATQGTSTSRSAVAPDGSGDSSGSDDGAARTPSAPATSSGATARTGRSRGPGATTAASGTTSASPKAPVAVSGGSAVP